MRRKRFCYFEARNSTTPWGGTVAEYTGPPTGKSLCAHRSLKCVGAEFRLTADQLTVICAGEEPRLNNPIARPPSDSGLAQTS